MPKYIDKKLASQGVESIIYYRYNAKGLVDFRGRCAQGGEPGVR